MLRSRIGQPLLMGLMGVGLLVGCSSKTPRRPTDDSGRKDSAKPGVDSKTLLDDSNVPVVDALLGKDTSTAKVDAPKPVVGQGYAVGQISMNWTLKDLNGKTVKLHDYLGKVIFFESGSEW